MHDPFDLERFVRAQQPLYSQALSELVAGAKRSHWMWFIFPQLQGLGLSPTARAFAISGRAQARAYLADPLLGARLIECTGAVNALEGRTVTAIFGHPDDLKFRSSMTLFADVASVTDNPFREALLRYFAGEEDPLTRERLT